MKCRARSRRSARGTPFSRIPYSTFSCTVSQSKEV